MRGKLGRIAASALLAMAAFFILVAPGQAAVTIGSDLSSTPNADLGACAVFVPLGRLGDRCTYAQVDLTPGHLAPGGLKAPAAGTILHWSVRSDQGSPKTAGVRLRLRALDAENEVGADGTPFVELPLGEPGIHTFPAHLEVEKGDRLVVEIAVTARDEGPAFAPIVHTEPAVGNVAAWHSPLFPGLGIPPDATREDTELLVSADLSFDRTPPQTKLTYPVRQNFLVEKAVLIHIRANEAATVISSGQLEIPSRHTIFGLRGAKATVGAGKRLTLRLRLARNTIKAARRAYANGRKIVIKVTASATDAAGNKSGASVATIKPLPPRR